MLGGMDGCRVRGCWATDTVVAAFAAGTIGVPNPNRPAASDNAMPRNRTGLLHERNGVFMASKFPKASAHGCALVACPGHPCLTVACRVTIARLLQLGLDGSQLRAVMR